MSGIEREKNKTSYASSSTHMYFMVVLRLFIGWHLLYEGILKLLDPAWTSADYLSGSSWIFSGLFHWMAENPGVLQVVDFLNTWGLILTGIGLFFGIFTNLAILSGIVLLGLYYLVSPPFIKSGSGTVLADHYLFIDRNLIELTTLFVLKFFNTGRFLGLDYFISHLPRKQVTSDFIEKKATIDEKSPGIESITPALKRREMLKQLATLPLFGTFVYALYRKRRWENIVVNHKKSNPSESGMSYGNIGDLRISRLIFGSNIPGVHSRDLIYVSKLGEAYNTRKRLLETYELAESQGINTILQAPTNLLREYNLTRGGNLKTIVPVNITENHNKESIRNELTKKLKERHDIAAAFYIWGDRGDYMARANRMDIVGTSMEVAKELGIVLGLGGHSLQVPIQCDELGIKPDFYVKTFHPDNYWSATPKENREDFCWYDDKGGNSYTGNTGDHDRFHDNMWCLDSEKTIEVMQKIKVPWIAFKVLAAGAISPASGFKYAFQNGADFIAVGMTDFQVEENVKVLKSLFAREIKRERPWYS